MATFKIVRDDDQLGIGSEFEKLVGKPISAFNTLAEMQAAIEKKIGRKLVSITVDVDEQRKRADALIAESKLLEKNF